MAPKKPVNEQRDKEYDYQDRFVNKTDYDKDRHDLKHKINQIKDDMTDMDKRHTERHNKTEKDVIRLMSKFEDMPETLRSLNKTMTAMWGKSNEQAEKIYRIDVEQVNQAKVVSDHAEKLKIVDEYEKKKVVDVTKIILGLITLIGTLGAAALGASWIWM